MKKHAFKQLSIFLFLLLNLPSFSQEKQAPVLYSEIVDLGSVTDPVDDFRSFAPLKKTLKDVEIIMLGEQSHSDGTTFDTKVKLIKFLHQEMDFDLLVFESGIYSCNKAWSKIKDGENAPIPLGSSIFELWSTTKQFRPLARYIDENKMSENPLEIAGFDSQLTGNISRNEFTSDLEAYLLTKDKSILKSPDWEKLKNSLELIFTYKSKQYSKDQAKSDTTYINTIIEKIATSDPLSEYWCQVLKSTKYSISDLKLKTDFRDKQMADNLIWIKEQNPNMKIICWGATSHFLYNASEVKMIGFPYNVIDNYYQKQPMMGDYIKKKYESKVYTIGFIAYEGEYGLTSRKRLKPAKENSLEYSMAESGLENCFIDLSTNNTKGYISRPLGNKYMKNDISNVMDGVILNKHLERARLDRNLFLKIHPDNKWVKPEIEDQADVN